MSLKLKFFLIFTPHNLSTYSQQKTCIFRKIQILEFEAAQANILLTKTFNATTLNRNKQISFIIITGNVIWHSSRLRIAASTCCWTARPARTDTFIASELSSEELKLPASPRHRISTEKCSFLADGQESFLSAGHDNRRLGSLDSVEAVAAERRG